MNRICCEIKIMKYLYLCSRIKFMNCQPKTSKSGSKHGANKYLMDDPVTKVSVANLFKDKSIKNIKISTFVKYQLIMILKLIILQFIFACTKSKDLNITLCETSNDCASDEMCSQRYG